VNLDLCVHLNSVEHYILVLQFHLKLDNCFSGVPDLVCVRHNFFACKCHSKQDIL
jgi:hypothetical protein